MSATAGLPTDLTPLLLQGHVLEVLRSLPEGSVQCAVTSPPYWGLRAYGTAPQVWGGDAAHAHEWTPTSPRRERSEADATSTIEQASVGGRNYEAQGGEACGGCGAWRGELGLEPTPELYVAHLADVFDEVRRVLREDGSCWLNLGDTYSGVQSRDGRRHRRMYADGGEAARAVGTGDFSAPEIPSKNLTGIPWRVAFELQRRGWWLRAEIIWAKPNPMPESVTDRPTRAHEQVFLLTKSARYFYDADAVRRPLSPSTEERAKNHYSNPTDNPDSDSKWLRQDETGDHRYVGFNARWRAYPVIGRRVGFTNGVCNGCGRPEAQHVVSAKSAMVKFGEDRDRVGTAIPCNGAGANLKSVWWIATQPYPEAHFATFPEALAETCLRAGTSERGACPACGAAWGRESDPNYEILSPPSDPDRPRSGFLHAQPKGQPDSITGSFATKKGGKDELPRARKRPITLGWLPTCSCLPADPVPCLVLDPFAGSGTVLSVARSLGLRSIGIELKPDYVALARRRCSADVPDLFSFDEGEPEPEPISEEVRAP